MEVRVHKSHCSSSLKLPATNTSPSAREMKAAYLLTIIMPSTGQPPEYISSNVSLSGKCGPSKQLQLRYHLLLLLIQASSHHPSR